MRFPVRCDQYELRPEPAAPGKWRGGIGHHPAQPLPGRRHVLVRGRPPARSAARHLRRLGRARRQLPQESRHRPGGGARGEGDGHPLRRRRVHRVPASPTRPATATRSSVIRRWCARTCSTTSRRSSSRATPTASSSATSRRSRSTRTATAERGVRRARARGRGAATRPARTEYYAERGLIRAANPARLRRRETASSASAPSRRASQGVRAGRRPAPAADHDRGARTRRAPAERGAARARVRRQPRDRARGAPGARRAEPPANGEGRRRRLAT